MTSAVADVPPIEQTLDGPEYRETDVPKSTPTAATKTAPAGRVVDDSSRGTIFWEIASDTEDNETAEGLADEESDPLADGEVDPLVYGASHILTDGDSKPLADGEARQSPPTADSPANLSSWSQAFRIEWISTVRVPFYRTRGLRNPWNSNREVKIARDGTELEPNTGKRLLQLFSLSAGSSPSHENTGSGFGIPRRGRPAT
jgi:hypothetical protein